MKRVSLFFFTLAGLLLFDVGQSLGVDILYDFEGDSGNTATDKLISDGTTNGILNSNASLTSNPGDVLIGSQSAKFELPNVIPTSPPYDTIEIPGSTALGSSFTLAAHVDNLEDTLGFTRLFSSYRGGGAVGTDRILLDYDPTGGVISGIRAIVGNTVVGTSSVPAALANPGYHHFALTVDNGAVSVYVDGLSVASGNVGAYTNSANLRFGEDTHELGSANEQLQGKVDDLLVINRALSSTEIGQLATNAASSVVTPALNEYAVLYDFEGDSGTTITDKFTLDGSQNGIAHQLVDVDTNGANAKFGSGSGNFPSAAGFSRIDVGALGNIGNKLTMAAVINVPDGGQISGGLTRLFSTYSGGGSPAGRLIFDFDPHASVSSIGLRVILPNGTAATANDTFTVNEDHHLAAVYDNGSLKVYLDGVEVASATGAPGDIDFGAFALRIGEDLGGIVNEQFVGSMDDVVFVSQALTEAQINEMIGQGAAAFFGVPEPSSVILLVLGMIGIAVGYRRKRK